MIKFASLLLLLSVLSSAQDIDSINDLSNFYWLEYTWEAKSGNSVIVEKWEVISPSTFEGLGYVQKMGGEKPDSYESLRMLCLKGEVFYLAKVDHNDMPIPFRLVHVEPDKFVFENKNHDFPKQITYLRLGTDSMKVRVGSLSDPLNRSFELKFCRKN
jgi:hypothetical protein